MTVHNLVQGSAQTHDPDRPDPRAIAPESGAPDFDSPHQSADRRSPWGAIGVGAALSVALHVGVLWLPMQKAQKPAALPLVNQEAPVPVSLVRSAPGQRSTLTPTPKRSTPAQAAKPASKADRAATRSPASPSNPRSRPSPSAAPARSTQPSNPKPSQTPRPDRSPAAPTPNGSPSPGATPDPVPSPLPDPVPSPPPDPTPQPPGLPGLVGLDAGAAACAPNQSCYSLPDNFSVHSVTSELIQNSLGSGVEVRELVSTYENTEVAREFEVAKLHNSQAPEIVGYYYVISTQVQGQMGAIIFGSRDRLATLEDIRTAAGANS